MYAYVHLHAPMLTHKQKRMSKKMHPNLYCIEQNILVHFGLRQKILAHERLETKCSGPESDRKNILVRLKNPGPPGSLMVAP